MAGALKRVVEEAFGYVRVRGEISGFKRHSSGHCYLTLKDDRACIDGVIWKGQAAALQFRPEDGVEVIATGRLTTYPGRSKYQIVIDRLELAGQGALMALLDQRRRALAAEGLFDSERKRPLPFLPRLIGVVTSPTGAVIRDILHRLEDRCPSHVLVWPVAVYPHTEGCSITGGYVYRGSEVPALRRRYVYGDFCSGRLWSLPTGGGRPQLLALPRLEGLSSFGLGERGELYATIEQHPDLMGKYGARMAVGVLNGGTEKGREFLVPLEVIKGSAAK